MTQGSAAQAAEPWALTVERLRRTAPVEVCRRRSGIPDTAAAAGLAGFLGRPHLVWLARSTAALVIVAVVLRIAMPIYRQQATVEEIQRLGGWFHNLFRFPEDATPAIGGGLRQLDRLTSLQGLSLEGMQLSKLGLGFLKELKNLKTLSLKNTVVSAADIADLQRALPGLEVEE
jgi:hypothetical protein